MLWLAGKDKDLMIYQSQPAESKTLGLTIQYSPVEWLTDVGHRDHFYVEMTYILDFTQF